MSVVTLQFGQCGNQIGQALFSNLYSDIKVDAAKACVSKRANTDYVTEAANRWFHVNKSGEWEARSILVDTENKVTSAAHANENYKFKNVVAKSHGGSANNWAFAYSYKSKLLIDEVMDAVRKEMERCDFVSSILSVLSSGGGTGSGVGSRTVEVLRQEYSNKVMMNTIVLPYKCGEVVTQNYNSLLTLAKVYDITDATYLYENDVMHRMCTKSLAISNVTMSDINSIIAQQLASVLQPVGNVSISRVVANLAAHPSYKLIQVKSAPHISKEHLRYEAACTWAVLLNRMRTSLRSNCNNVHDNPQASEVSRRFRCVGNVLITRGGATAVDEDLKPFMDSGMYVPWLPIQGRLTHYHQPRLFQDMSRFFTLLTNNSYVCPALDTIMEDAWAIFKNGAYLHHYQKYDVDEQDFLGAFEKMEKVFQDYNTL